jgi:predicted DNA-binding protein
MTTTTNDKTEKKAHGGQLPTLRVSPEHYERLRKFAKDHNESLREAAEDAIDTLLDYKGPSMARKPIVQGNDIEAKVVEVVQRIPDQQIRNQVLLDMYVALR